MKIIINYYIDRLIWTIALALLAQYLIPILLAEITVTTFIGIIPSLKKL
jgi:hypothetical protein